MSVVEAGIPVSAAQADACPLCASHEPAERRPLSAAASSVIEATLGAHGIPAFDGWRSWRSRRSALGAVRRDCFLFTCQTARRNEWRIESTSPATPTLVLTSVVSFFLFPFCFPIRYSLFAFSIRHPDEGMAERRQAPGRCVAPGSARHDRRAGAVLSAPSVLKRGERPPLGAPPWRFCGPGLCSPLSGIPSAIVRRPHTTHGSSLPGGPGLAGLPRGFADPQT